jgi:HSP20 family protein
MALPDQRRLPAAQRWTPLRDFEQVAETMRRMLDDTLGEAAAQTAAWVPAVDVEETDGAYVVEVEVPGVKKDDVNIELIGNELTISGEIKEKEREGLLRRRTRRTGRFEYRVTLPDHVDANGVDAELHEGVLTVRVPKAEAAHRQRIEVRS